jgi:hypothetical protein
LRKILPDAGGAGRSAAVLSNFCRTTKSPDAVLSHCCKVAIKGKHPHNLLWAYMCPLLKKIPNIADILSISASVLRLKGFVKTKGFIDPLV